MKLGFVVSNYPDEKRVSLLPKDIQDFQNEVVIEEGLGLHIGVSDQAYEEAGCTVATREEVFKQCDAIVALKVLQPEDYDFIREGQMIIGWIHPEVSGKDFWQDQGISKKLIGVDLDNIKPRIYYQDQYVDIPWIPKNFVSKNSFNAGISSTMHALMIHGLILNDDYNVAILGSGNVSQGAMHVVSKFTSNVQMYYRKTMDEFIDNIDQFDIIISGIELAEDVDHIVTKADQDRMKEGTLIIDAAADADGCIEGTTYTTMDEPIIEKDNKYYYGVNNSPTIYHRSASADISKSFSQWVYKEDVQKLYDLAKEIM